MVFGYNVFGNTPQKFKSEDLLSGWKLDSNWTLKGINALCPDKTGGSESCNGTPFTEFTIRGTEGTKMDDGRWWWVNNNTLGLSNYEGGDDKSGACEIHIREGYQVKLRVRFETEGEYGFIENSFAEISTDSPGILEKTEDSFTVLMRGGDKLSIDIDSDWSGTARFYLKVQGTQITNSSDSIDDEVYVTLESVYVAEEANDDDDDDDDDDGEDEALLTDNQWWLVGGVILVGLAGFKIMKS
tara:strand:- start:8705 stop:9430 length:726 start_codon:yes stop_codon:yes gene_type:complete